MRYFCLILKIQKLYKPLSISTFRANHVSHSIAARQEEIKFIKLVHSNFTPNPANIVSGSLMKCIAIYAERIGEAYSSRE